MNKHLVSLLLICVGIMLPSVAQTKSVHSNRAAWSAHDPLLRNCLDMYGTDVFTEDGVTLKRAMARETQREHNAQNFFSHIRSGELDEKLTPYFRRLKPGSLAYTSVAYVLLFFGVDTTQNAERMMLMLSNIHESDAMEAWPWRMETCYHRHPTDGVLNVLLKAQGDGIVSEYLDSICGRIFVKIPTRALRVAARDKKTLSKLAATLYGETVMEESPAMRTKIFRILQRANAHGDRAAHYCLQYIKKQQKVVGE